METILSVTGSVLSIVGLVLIFRFGLAPLLRPISSGVMILNPDEDIIDRNSPVNIRNRRYRRLAFLGLGLSITGELIPVFAILSVLLF